MKLLLVLFLLSSPIQERNPVLRYLNDLCGDTWCEGSYQYDFKRIECCKKTCTLEFHAKREGADHPGQTCKISRKDYRNARGWITRGERFHEYEMGEKFFYVVDSCIEEFEKLELEAFLR